MKHSNIVENSAKETSTIIKSAEKKPLTLEEILNGIESAADRTSNIVKNTANNTFSNMAGEYLRQSKMAVLESKTRVLFNEAKKTQKKGAVTRLAAMSDDTKFLDYLIAHHSDKLEKSKNGRGLLSYAAEYASKSTVEHLIDYHKFDRAETDNDGSTILHFAAKGDKYETLQTLVEKYQLNVEAVNNDGDFAMHFAARNSRYNTIYVLYDKYDLDPEFSNNNAFTALDYAAAYGHNEMIKFLIEVYELDPLVAGSSALYLAAINGKNETIDLLVKDYNFNAKGKNDDGDNLLHLAAQSGHMKTIQHLVKYHQLDPAEKTADGQSILDIVLENGFKNLAYPLLSQFPALRNDGGVGEKLWQSRQMRTALPHTLAQFALEKAKEGKYLRLPAEVVQRIADATDEINFESLTDKQREQLPAPGDKALAKRCRYFNNK